MSPCWRSATDLWRRIRLEFVVELPLLRERWKTILLGAVFQYVHAMATQLAHRMHRPMMQPLHDVGFDLLPELGKSNEWVSELIFTSLFVSFVLWTFSPFVFAKKRFYTAVLFSRLLTALVVCQTLRILSFTVTQLPASNYHCREGEATAIREMPDHWWGHVTVDVKRQATHGCGDLIFSSHTTFALMGALTYHEYGTHLATKVIVWVAVAVLSVLIVASRKHYSVDVLIAWYVVPLVFWTLHRRWTTKRNTNDGVLLGDTVYLGSNIESAAELQDIVIEGDGQQSSLLKGDADGHGVKGHASSCSPNKVGTVIGIIANGFSGLQHNGASAHSANGLQNGFMPQGLMASMLQGKGGSGAGTPPGTPPNGRSGSISSSADDGGSIRKSSPLSSMRPRASAVADAYSGKDTYQPMLRDEDGEWGTRGILDSRSSSVNASQGNQTCSMPSSICHIS
ncbi:phosphatidylinositol:ceramide inositolphosphotransferase at N-terminal half [Coccomyxa sp. Obi]|nr:phosphatidylinositol:ceramide inositolphosphotransferase at N-terminal half [Coccomyxa sp. Obi]